MSDSLREFLADARRADPRFVGVEHEWEHLCWEELDASDLPELMRAACVAGPPADARIAALIYWGVFTAIAREDLDRQADLRRLLQTVDERARSSVLRSCARQSIALLEDPPPYNVWDLYRSFSVKDDGGRWQYAGSRRKKRKRKR